jgi:hypothetical protein
LTSLWEDGSLMDVEIEMESDMAINMAINMVIDVESVP